MRPRIRVTRPLFSPSPFPWSKYTIWWAMLVCAAKQQSKPRYTWPGASARVETYHHHVHHDLLRPDCRKIRTTLATAALPPCNRRPTLGHTIQQQTRCHQRYCSLSSHFSLCLPTLQLHTSVLSPTTVVNLPRCPCCYALNVYFFFLSWNHILSSFWNALIHKTTTFVFSSIQNHPVLLSTLLCFRNTTSLACNTPLHLVKDPVDICETCRPLSRATTRTF